jgi:hypothetical protein
MLSGEDSRLEYAAATTKKFSAKLRLLPQMFLEEMGL